MKKTQILWFSGSGNSRFVAGQIARTLPGAELIKICEKTKGFQTEGPNIGFVCPVHSFRLPISVIRFIESAAFSGIEYAWAVFTMGGAGYRAWDDLSAALAAKGVIIKTRCRVILPDNCIYLYPANSTKGPAITGPIIAQSDEHIERAVDKIKHQTRCDDQKKSPVMSFLLSGILGGLFMSDVIKEKKRPWHVSEKCTGCGHCENICPEGNISMRDKKPLWGKNCVLCMGCIQWCPEGAINYKSATQNRGRYHHPGVKAKEMYA